MFLINRRRPNKRRLSQKRYRGHPKETGISRRKSRKSNPHTAEKRLTQKRQIRPLKNKRKLKETERIMKLGIVGWPLKETLSPAIHNKAFGEMGLAASYKSYPIKNSNDIFPIALNEKLSGFNITSPHKPAVAKLLPETISKEAKITQSVNCVIYSDGTFKGENFDIYGFETSFKTIQTFDKGEFIIFGNGGAARSVYYALAKNNAKTIIIKSRNIKKAEKLHEYYDKTFPYISKEILQSDYDLKKAARNAKGIINCTPCSMKGYSDDVGLFIPETTNKNCLVFDLVYIPFNTKFTIQAQTLGLKFKNGLEMLLLQGLKSFNMWTGKIFNLKSMYDYAKYLLYDF